MKIKFATILLLSMTSHTFAGIDLEWESFSDPSIMSSSFERSLSKLPSFGEASGTSKYWSGSYWALNMGNINYRWNSKEEEGFNLESPSKSEAMTMSQEELSALAPSEKFDLFTGNYDYPLRNQVAILSNSRAKEWEGICNGWAGASINHNEPIAKVMINPDGIKIPFGSADIKALLSFYYAFGFKIENSYQMGMRCFSGPFLNMNPHCSQDLNAGAFHIVLANKMGLQGSSFLVDVDRYKEVWNHPVRAYRSQYLERSSPRRDAAEGTASVLRVATTFTYVDESVNSWFPLIGSEDQILKTKDYEYELDLDANDRILGGRWLSNERPDFLWLVPKQVQFQRSFSRLIELLND